MAVQSVKSADVRVENRRRILELLMVEGEKTRQELQRDLGLSLPTVQNLVTDMLDSGLLTTGTRLESAGGRRPTTVCINPTAHYAVGAYVFSTYVQLALVDMTGAVLRTDEFRIRPEGLDALAEVDLQELSGISLDQVRERAEQMHTPAFFETLGRQILRFLEDADIPTEKVLGISVALGGRVDGTVWECDGLRSELRDLTVPMEKILGIPVHYGNDGKFVAAAEVWRLKLRSAAVLFLGLGIGGGVILDGRVYEGRNGHATEFGHIPLERGGILCSCGRRGCSGSRLQVSRLRTSAYPTLDRFFAGVDAGDRECLAIWQQYADDLAAVLIALDVIFDENIVVAGIPAAFMEAHRADIEAAVSRCNGPQNQLGGGLYFGSLGGIAPAAGGALTDVLKNFIIL